MHLNSLRERESTWCVEMQLLDLGKYILVTVLCEWFTIRECCLLDVSISSTYRSRWLDICRHHHGVLERHWFQLLDYLPSNANFIQWCKARGFNVHNIVSYVVSLITPALSEYLMENKGYRKDSLNVVAQRPVEIEALLKLCGIRPSVVIHFNYKFVLSIHIHCLVIEPRVVDLLRVCKNLSELNVNVQSYSSTARELALAMIVWGRNLIKFRLLNPQCSPTHREVCTFSLHAPKQYQVLQLNIFEHVSFFFLLCLECGRHLTSLDLKEVRNPVSSRALWCIPSYCPNLTSLTLPHYYVDDDTMPDFWQLPNLTALDLMGTAISPKTVNMCAKCPNLTELKLGGKGTTLRLKYFDLLHISTKCPRLRSLAIVAPLPSEAVNCIASLWCHLTSLHLGSPGSELRDDSFCRLFRECTRLTSVNISYQNVTIESIQALREFCPDVKVLHIGSCSHLVKANVMEVLLSNNQSLTGLHMPSSTVLGDILPVIVRLGVRLKFINLLDSIFQTADQLLDVARLPCLRVLLLDKTFEFYYRDQMLVINRELIFNHLLLRNAPCSYYY